MGPGDEAQGTTSSFASLSLSLPLSLSPFLSLSLSLGLSLSSSRLDILCRQKEQQLRDLVALGDEHVEIEERSEEVRGRVEDVRRRAAQLTQR